MVRNPAPALRVVGASEVESILEFAPLIERLREAFRLGADIPPRHHHTIPTDGVDATLLLMPAWRKQRFIGVKLLTIFPDNPRNALPALSGTYLLMSGLTGRAARRHRRKWQPRSLSNPQRKRDGRASGEAQRR